MIGAEWCRWHGGLIGRGAVLVGALERGSGPPLLVHACPTCARDRGLLPLFEHPNASDGTPRTRGAAGAGTAAHDEAPATSAGAGQLRCVRCGLVIPPGAEAGGWANSGPGRWYHRDLTACGPMLTPPPLPGPLGPWPTQADLDRLLDT